MASGARAASVWPVPEDPDASSPRSTTGSPAPAESRDADVDDRRAAPTPTATTFVDDQDGLQGAARLHLLRRRTGDAQRHAARSSSRWAPSAPTNSTSGTHDQQHHQLGRNDLDDQHHVGRNDVSTTSGGTTVDQRHLGRRHARPSATSSRRHEHDQRDQHDERQHDELDDAARATATATATATAATATATARRSARLSRPRRSARCAPESAKPGRRGAGT